MTSTGGALPLPTRVGDVDHDWVERAIASDSEGLRPTVSALRPFTESDGLLSTMLEAEVTWDPSAAELPSSVLIKLPPADAESRAVADAYRAFEREVAFYNDVASRASYDVPRCWFARHDRDGRAAIVLDLLPSAAMPDEGMTVDQTEQAIDALVAVHASCWQAPPLRWMPGFDQPGLAGLSVAWKQNHAHFVTRYASRVPEQVAAWLAESPGWLERWSAAAATEPLTVVHADMHAGNLLFTSDGVVIIDWQTALRGPGAMDLVSLLITSLSIETRRTHESAMVDRYLTGLTDAGLTVDRDWFSRSLEENLMWWLGQYANNLAHLAPPPRQQRALSTMVERIVAATLDHDVGRLLG